LTFGLKPSTAYAIVRSFEATGEMTPRKRGGATRSKMTQVAQEAIEQWINDSATMTLRQIKTRLSEQFGIFVSEKTVSLSLTKCGFTFKLVRALPTARNTPEAIISRRQYAEMFLRDAPADQRNIIWVDECGFNLYLRRKHGRARIGQRATITVPNNRGQNQSVCAAMSSEGFLHYSHISGAFSATRFCEFLESLFIILRSQGRSACWIILDNVRFHHCVEVNRTTVQAGHSLIFLPAYSPMLNPIESLFGKWKTSIRTNGVSFTPQALVASLTHGRSQITLSDCHGWIRDVNRNLVLCLRDHIFD
jgi:transposase